MEPVSRPELFDFRGVSLTRFVTSNFDAVQSFQARPDDILIATYPKAGTTWVSYILDLLYFGQMSGERETTVPIYNRVPFLEFSLPNVKSGKELADNLPTSPRLIKTHFPVQFVPKSFWQQNCRIVYVARNAKDSMVSFFHFDRMNAAQPEPGPWDDYFRKFMEGKVLFGSWYDHVNGWWRKKQTYSNIHYMFYEDMVEDTGREIDRLCSFLGLSPSAEERSRVGASVHFDSMRDNAMTNFSAIRLMDFNVAPFMRKGKVGDWKNHFTEAQHQEFEEDYRTKMKDSSLQFRSAL